MLFHPCPKATTTLPEFYKSEPLSRFNFSRTSAKLLLLTITTLWRLRLPWNKRKTIISSADVNNHRNCHFSNSVVHSNEPSVQSLRYREAEKKISCGKKCRNYWEIINFHCFPMTQSPQCHFVLTLSKDTSDFLVPKTAARYLTNSVFASPSTGGADIAMPTPSSEISTVPMWQKIDLKKFLFYPLVVQIGSESSSKM